VTRSRRAAEDRWIDCARSQGLITGDFVCGIPDSAANRDHATFQPMSINQAPIRIGGAAAGAAGLVNETPTLSVD
jgi:hypothetical protein